MIFQQVVQSTTSFIVGTFQNIVTMLSTPEGRILLAHVLGPIILDVLLEMAGYGLFVSMKDIILEFTQPVINYITALISIVSLIANLIPLTKLASAMTRFMMYAKVGINLMREVLTNNFAVKFILKKLDEGYELVKISGEFCIKKGSDVRKCTSFLGCFTKNTPVLMVSKRSDFQSENRDTKSRFSERTVQSLAQLGDSLKNTTAAYAMVALPIISIPIQDVQLFDYAVAHKSVNSSYGLTASSDDTFIIGKDPYTSDQQRSRDQYEINDTDWNEVSFEEVNGTSTCKLALHSDWISNHDYTVDGIINMNLPEQGISGPFRITSIKHIIPQKKPVDEDPNDEWEYRPVTGLFTHLSNDVWKITFDNGEVLGVTNNHPIYSVLKGNWQNAGHLEIGEEVLAKGSNTKVVGKERDQALQLVYNLEVKDLHNFLVGNVGVVVHNSCLDWISKLHLDWLNKGTHFNVPLSNGRIIEIIMSPDSKGGYILKKWLKQDSDKDFAEGLKYLNDALRNKDFQKKLTKDVERAITLARDNGSKFEQEFRFLHANLKKLFNL